VTETNGGSSNAEVDFNGVAAHALISQDTTQCNIGCGGSSEAGSEEDPEELEATSEESDETEESEQADPEIESASVDDEQTEDSTEDEIGESEATQALRSADEAVNQHIEEDDADNEDNAEKEDNEGEGEEDTESEE
jgi:hypothetical protein